jgi:hypothetical protein
VHDSFRVGEASGEAGLTVYGLSPYLFPQRRVRNWKYLPLNRDLPQGQMDFTVLVFSWGFTPDAPGLASLETQNKVIQLRKNTWVWAMNGVSNDNTGPASSNLGFQFQLYHTHNGVQSRWSNRPLLNTEALGSGSFPKTLTQPHLFLAGDSVEVEVKNLGKPVAPSVTSISVALFGGEYEGAS